MRLERALERGLGRGREVGCWDRVSANTHPSQLAEEPGTVDYAMDNP